MAKRHNHSNADIAKKKEMRFMWIEHMTFR